VTIKGKPVIVDTKEGEATVY